MNSSKRGAFIVIEGIDCSGKSTQCRKLVDNLKAANIKAELMSFPDRTTPIGGLISEYLKNKTDLSDEAIHLLFSANRWECVQKIKDTLYSGATLVVDRYSYSGVAYSTAKSLDINWCKQPENGLPKPDLVFFLYLDPENVKNRPGFGNERYEKESMQQKVFHVFQQFCQEDNSWIVINADENVEKIQDDLQKKAINVIKCVGDKPLGKLDFNQKKLNGYH